MTVEIFKGVRPGMSKWGKAIGVGLGYYAGGPVWALIGYLIGRGAANREEGADSHSALRSHYDTLQVRPSADMEEIKRSYRRLVRQYHPDLHGHLDDKGLESMKGKAAALNEAYREIRKARGAC